MSAFHELGRVDYPDEMDVALPDGMTRDEAREILEAAKTYIESTLRTLLAMEVGRVVEEVLEEYVWRQADEYADDLTRWGE